jgi:hypothetical protein
LFGVGVLGNMVVQRRSREILPNKKARAAEVELMIRLRP